MAKKFITMILDGLADKSVQKNFQVIENELNEDLFKKGQFRFIEIKVIGAGTLKWPHRLGFMPTDVITLSVSKPDTATVSWKFDQFTRDNIVLVTSAACTVRAFVGSFKE